MATEHEMKALHLISANDGGNHPSDVKANSIINLNVKSLLAHGLIKYAPRRRCGYALTPAGIKLKTADDKARAEKDNW